MVRKSNTLSVPVARICRQQAWCPGWCNPARKLSLAYRLSVSDCWDSPNASYRHCPDRIRFPASKLRLALSSGCRGGDCYKEASPQLRHPPERS
eukprot:363205-Chlamydomonas_euryale.AAC.12